jgi:hypothetical protein
VEIDTKRVIEMERQLELLVTGGEIIRGRNREERERQRGRIIEQLRDEETLKQRERQIGKDMER